VSVDTHLRGDLTVYSQPQVLAALAAHSRLTDEWRALLPCLVPSNDRSGTRPVESDRQGITLAEALARRPHHLEELTAAALTAIAPLHRQTATLIVVDDVCLLPRWVGQPLAGLTEMCQPVDPDLVPALDRLRKVLREALVGRRMPTCWIHGHYTPGNVRLDVGGSVIGIEDWGWARPAQLALIDEYLMILTASRQVEQAELGAIVAARLQSGGLLARERNALGAMNDRPNAYSENCEPIDERTAILLTWLHFAAGQLRRRATYSKVSSWWAADVAPVLQTVMALPGLLPADDRRAYWRRG
jgi:Phosphotransferase enzyme family